jgi:hypothetical protein
MVDTVTEDWGLGAAPNEPVTARHPGQSPMCDNLFGPCGSMAPFAKVLSAKRLEVVKRLKTSAACPSSWLRVMHAVQSVPQRHQHLRAESRANVWSPCLRKSIPETEDPTISSFWTLMEWMRTPTKNVCTPPVSEKGKNADGVSKGRWQTCRTSNRWDNY